MKIYPTKPKPANEVLIDPRTAYGLIRQHALGQKKWEDVCSELGCTGEEAEQYRLKFKQCVEEIEGQLQKAKGAKNITEFKAAINIKDELVSKSQIVDDLVELTTSEGTFAALKTLKSQKSPV